MQFLQLSQNLTKQQKTYTFCLVLALVILAFVLFETFQSLNTLWQFNNESYSHGYLVLGLILYSFYERRDLFVFKPTLSPVPLALVVGLAWTATNSVNVKLGEYLLLPAILFLFIVTCVGWKRSLTFALPIAALFCALPIISYVNEFLQVLTVLVVSNMMKMTDITAFIDGFFITLPHGILHVDTSCSGLSYLSAGITFAMIYSFMSIRRKRVVAFSLVFIVILSLIANWIRVFLLVVVAYDSKMQSPLVAEHGFMGWIIFAFIFVFYLFVMRKIEARFDSKPSESAVSDEQSSQQLNSNVSFAKSTSPLLIAIAIAIAPIYAGIAKPDEASLASMSVSFPESFEGALIEDYTNQDSVVFLGADEARKVSGEKGELEYTAYAVLYKTQSQEKEMIYYKNKVGENLIGQSTLNVGDAPINYAIEQGQEDNLVFWLYRVGESEALTSASVKATQVKYMFESAPALALILKLPCGSDCNSVLNADETLTLLEQLRSVTVGQ
ncbi:exosortase [Glaciecola sp. XM2]|uniref:exosortase n=1 Tax=Glaciecola sp. XM2 TaxID=1914931 RepID=UPI001BDE2682|nr:exosortase [Glaciecola sp. XM2]MBT1450661.1 exosortase [Glaciecola sp. XM2]